jgi:hypothetical protein
VAHTISINQHAYIEAMVDKFCLTNVKPVSMLMKPGMQFSKDQYPSSPNQVVKMWGIPYSEALGSVLWPVVIPRPDAAFAVSVLSQFVQNPGPVHWEVLKCVIVYLSSTKDLWLTFGGCGKALVEVFCDADFANQKDQHSISGYSSHIERGAVTWSSKKQMLVALSTVEVEYIAQAHVVKEVLWLCTFIRELCGETKKPIMIHCNNQGAIALSKDNRFHTWMKNIDIQYHFIHEAVEDGKVSVVYIPTDDNLADIFMKPLSKAKFCCFIELLGLWSIKAVNHWDGVGRPHERIAVLEASSKKMLSDYNMELWHYY